MILGHIGPSFRFLKKWGISALFVDIKDDAIVCKCHKLKYIYMIDSRTKLILPFQTSSKMIGHKKFPLR